MSRIIEQNICSYGFKENAEKGVIDINSDEIKICMEFIARYLKPDRRGHSSYHFKHAAEKQYNHYVTNGAFIVAAIRLGCRVERLGLSSLNARIYMDYKK